VSGFHLRDLIRLCFHELASATPLPFAVAVFAIITGVTLYLLIRVSIWIFPLAWPSIERAMWKSVDWQAEKIFRWAKRHAQTKESVRWAVLCAMTISSTILIVLRIRILIPLLAIVLPTSLLTFTILGWRVRGPKAKGSWRVVFRFLRSFYMSIVIPTVGYTALAAITTLILTLWDLL
jgi:hypothetical protein